ncbi:MAG: hypothetical protein WC250_01400 [Candidatus Paceibacterota bacterium]|jgi:hypothetical protein
MKIEKRPDQLFCIYQRVGDPKKQLWRLKRKIWNTTVPGALEVWLGVSFARWQSRPIRFLAITEEIPSHKIGGLYPFRAIKSKYFYLYRGW